MNSASIKKIWSRLQRASRFHELSPLVRKIIVGIIGGLVLLAGIALLFLPGPAFVVIPLGLAILASEFGWARHYLLKAREWFGNIRKKSKKARRSIQKHFRAQG